MDINKQIQTAGENSQQWMANTVNVYNNCFTEERIAEICQQQFELMAKDLIEEARTEAAERDKRFLKKMLPKLASYDDQYKAFADPSFINAILNALKAAACSRREVDYDLLAELMLQRVKSKDRIEYQLGINKAIDVVNQVPMDALMGLTVLFVLTKIEPLDEDFKGTLKTYNTIFRKIIGRKKLPEGTLWQEQLNILSAIRIGELGINKSSAFFPLLFPKFFVSGVAIQSEEYETMKAELKSVGLPMKMLVTHPLREGYVKLYTSEAIDEIKVQDKKGNKFLLRKLNKEEKEVMQRIIQKTRVNETTNINMQHALLREWDKYPYLKRVREWFDALKYAPMITPVGDALANAYGHCMADEIPLANY